MTIDINELRMLTQDFKLAGSPMFLQTTQMNELLDRLEAAEKERDALRSLVVMRFDHDHPPQFVQGYDPHELNEPVTAEHCRWFVAEIERLRAKIAEMEKQAPVAWCATDETGTVVEALGMNQSRRFDTALYLAPGAKGE